MQATDAAEVRRFVQHDQPSPLPPVELVVRMRFKPELNKTWFAALNKLWASSWAPLPGRWPWFLALLLIGSVFFAVAHASFRSAITAMV